MTKETRSSNRKGRRGDPNQDVQPWLGWIAAMLVVVIVVVAVAMGMERTGNQLNNAAEVRMTPLVGGMQVPVATQTGVEAVASNVTPVPEVITDTGTVTMVTVITATDSLTSTLPHTTTQTMTPTQTLSPTESISPTAAITTTVEMSVTTAPTATTEPTSEPTATEEPIAEATATEEPTTEATATPTATATSRPTATTRPTLTPTVVAQIFEVGDLVAASNGRVEIYSDASPEALVLDSVGAGVDLEVLDPSGDFDEYPVVVDGHGWVRVRAADGLVGWVMTDQVEAK